MIVFSFYFVHMFSYFPPALFNVKIFISKKTVEYPASRFVQLRYIRCLPSDPRKGKPVPSAGCDTREEGRRGGGVQCGRPGPHPAGGDILHPAARPSPRTAATTSQTERGCRQSYQSCPATSARSQLFIPATGRKRPSILNVEK